MLFPIPTALWAQTLPVTEWGGSSQITEQEVRQEIAAVVELVQISEGIAFHCTLIEILHPAYSKQAARHCTLDYKANYNPEVYKYTDLSPLKMERYTWHEGNS